MRHFQVESIHLVLALIDLLQVYRNPGRVAPYTNYSGESIDLDLFEDDQLGHPGGHHDDGGDPKDNNDESVDEDIGDPNNIETSVALFNERP